MTLTQPTGKIVALGRPLVDECKVENATSMYPGRLVRKGTNDDDVVVCGAGDKPVGWLGYEHAAGPYIPDTLATAYSANDWAPVLFGGGFVIKAKLASGQNVARGAWLVPGANGQVVAAATLGDNIVVGIAMESKDASGGAKDILVLSLI